MVSHLQYNIDQIKNMLQCMADLAGLSLGRSIDSLFGPDPVMAQRVIDDDKAINSFEIDIDAAVYRRLALERPNENDLRLLLSIQKINICLERIGDHAVNIAESVIMLSSSPDPKSFYALPEMAKLTNAMYHDVTECFFAGDAGRAQEILERDDAIDALNAAVLASVKEKVLAGDEHFESALELVRISRNLERVADLSTNIAEQAIFCLQGQIVKHHAQSDVMAADKATAPAIA